MVKRVLSVVGVFFLYFLVFFIGTIGFLLWSEGKFSITEEQFYNYGTCFGNEYKNRYCRVDRFDRYRRFSIYCRFDFSKYIM